MNPGDAVPTSIGSILPRDKELESYAAIGSTAVLIWDIILHAPEDYEQIRKQGFLKLSRIVYCFSRFSTLVYMLALCILHTAPIGNCAWIRYVAYIFPLTIPITLLLFVFRVYALFRNRSHVLIFIFVSWLLVLGGAIMVAVQAEGVSISGTKFCTQTDGKSIAGAVSTITRFFHDTLVFIVTSWWLYRSNSTDDSSFATVLFGRHLFPLTRSLLHDGQAYYLATLLLNVVVIALPLMNKPFVPPCTLGSPLLVLITNMASHVYRNLVSAKYRDHCEFLQWEDGKWQERSTEVSISEAMKSAPSSEGTVGVSRV